MKLYTLIFAFVMTLQGGIQQGEHATPKNITVTVAKTMSNKGTVNFALYTKEGFMRTPIQTVSSTIENNTCQVVFKNVPQGEYAIICFHDENENNQMDFDEGRMPVEDYGVSNNPAGFGPPQYDTAKFVVSDKDVTLEIKF